MPRPKKIIKPWCHEKYTKDFNDLPLSLKNKFKKNVEKLLNQKIIESISIIHPEIEDILNNIKKENTILIQKQNTKKTISEHQQTIKELEEKINNLNLIYSNKINDRRLENKSYEDIKSEILSNHKNIHKEQHQKEIQELKQQHQQSIQDLKQQHQQSIQDLKQKHQTEIELIKYQHTKYINEYDELFKKLTEEKIKKIKYKYNTYIDQLKNKYEIISSLESNA